MRIFKNKTAHRILVPVLAVCVVILLDLLMNFMLSEVTYADWFNASVREIEASGEDVDLLFIGASRTHRTFIPEVFREKLNLKRVLNAGSAIQPVRATYFELKDLIERVHPHHVVIGVTWNGLSGKESILGRLIAYDRLSLKNRLLMLVKGFDPDEWPYLCAAYRFRDNFSLDVIRENISEKIRLARTNYRDPEGAPPAHDYGYDYRSASDIKGNVSIPTGNMKISRPLTGFSRKRVREQYYQTLSDCVDLCRRNNIKVTLVSGVTSVARMYEVKNYQSAVKYYTEFAEERGISYYNLNYLKNRETFLPDEMMYDINHVNDDGAALVSGIFAEILEKADRGEDVSSYFYSNLDELKKDVHRIVGVGAEITADPAVPDEYRIAADTPQRHEVDVVYRALLRRDGQEDFEVVRDWAPQRRMALHLPDAVGATLRIEAGSADGAYGCAYHEYVLKAGMPEEEGPEKEESEEEVSKDEES